jgi:hypothetical protein
VHRIWQVNQTDATDTASVDLGEGGVHLLIARPKLSVEIEVVSTAAFAALDALARGETLKSAFEIAQGQDAAFDPGVFLRGRTVAHTLVDFRVDGDES